MHQSPEPLINSNHEEEHQRYVSFKDPKQTLPNKKTPYPFNKTDNKFLPITLSIKSSTSSSSSTSYEFTEDDPSYGSLQICLPLTYIILLLFPKSTITTNTIKKIEYIVVGFILFSLWFALLWLVLKGGKNEVWWGKGKVEPVEEIVYYDIYDGADNYYNSGEDNYYSSDGDGDGYEDGDNDVAYSDDWNYSNNKH